MAKTISKDLRWFRTEIALYEQAIREREDADLITLTDQQEIAALREGLSALRDALDDLEVGNVEAARSSADA